MGRSRDRSYSKSPSRSRSRSRSGSLSSSSSGRTAKAKDWNGEGGYRLHLSDLAMGVSRREIEKLFRPYGPLNEVWVASNPPCFAFINFRHRADGEQALKEVDGKVVGGSRVGLSWARPRNYGGRPTPSRYRSPSPRRRGYRDSYSSRRYDDRYSKRRYSRSRSRSPGYRRRRSSSSRSRSSTPRDRRDKRSKDRRRRSDSRSNSDRGDSSPYQKNGKHVSRSPSNERQQASSSNGNGNNNHHHADVEINGED